MWHLMTNHSAKKIIIISITIVLDIRCGGSLCAGCTVCLGTLWMHHQMCFNENIYDKLHVQIYEFMLCNYLIMI